VILTVGVSERCTWRTAILEPGEEVLVPTPCFVAYQTEVVLAGGVPVEIPSRVQDNFNPTWRRWRRRSPAPRLS
jgi:aminotransferase